MVLVFEDEQLDIPLAQFWSKDVSGAASRLDHPPLRAPEISVAFGLFQAADGQHHPRPGHLERRQFAEQGFWIPPDGRADCAVADEPVGSDGQDVKREIARQ